MKEQLNVLLFIREDGRPMISTEVTHLKEECIHKQLWGKETFTTFTIDVTVDIKLIKFSQENSVNNNSFHLKYLINFQEQNCANKNKFKLLIAPPKCIKLL